MEEVDVLGRIQPGDGESAQPLDIQSFGQHRVQVSEELFLNQALRGRPKRVVVGVSRPHVGWFDCDRHVDAMS
jgi:hypothetical protein